MLKTIENYHKSSVKVVRDKYSTYPHKKLFTKSTGYKTVGLPKDSKPHKEQRTLFMPARKQMWQAAASSSPTSTTQRPINKSNE